MKAKGLIAGYDYLQNLPGVDHRILLGDNLTGNVISSLSLCFGPSGTNDPYRSKLLNVYDLTAVFHSLKEL